MELTIAQRHLEYGRFDILGRGIQIIDRNLRIQQEQLEHKENKIYYDILSINALTTISKQLIKLGLKVTSNPTEADMSEIAKLGDLKISLNDFIIKVETVNAN